MTKDHNRIPVIFVSHGAATLSMDPAEPSYALFANVRKRVLDRKPRAVLVVSAHDERSQFTVATADNIEMEHDHPAGKDLSWSGRGDAGLADHVADLIATAGLDVERGLPKLDHGAWIPLIHIDPEATIPIVTLSIRRDGDPAAHFALGQAIKALSDDSILVLASGGATHNQSAFRQSYFADNPSSHTEDFSEDFDQWVR